MDWTQITTIYKGPLHLFPCAVVVQSYKQTNRIQIDTINEITNNLIRNKQETDIF
jgi:hypothetical protein